MKSIAVFNNKGGVGKTTFTYHLGFALEKLGKKVLFVDGDPQCNLTAYTCEDDVIDAAWEKEGNSLYQAVRPLVTAAGDVNYVQPYKIQERNIWIYPGDLLISEYESALSESWTQVLAGQERGFRVSSGIYRLYSEFARANEVDYVLIDLGPNLGSLNRALLLGCDFFIIPMIPDLFSLRGSQNLGSTLATWAKLWYESLQRTSGFDFEVQKGTPMFLGYILQQFNVYRKKPTKAWSRWASEIPTYINNYVVTPLSSPGIPSANLVVSASDYKLGEMKNYHGLIPMSQDALKPVFELKTGDGVIGDHHKYVKQNFEEYKQMAEIILTKTI